MSKRLIIGISGASGVIYGIRLLQALERMTDVETHLVLSNAAEETIKLETKYSIQQVQQLASEPFLYEYGSANLQWIISNRRHGSHSLLHKKSFRNRQLL